MSDIISDSHKQDDFSYNSLNSNKNKTLNVNDFNHSTNKQPINGDLNKSNSVNLTPRTKKLNQRSNSTSSSLSSSISFQKHDTKNNSSNKCYIKLSDSNSLKNNQQQLVAVNSKNSTTTKNTKKSNINANNDIDLNLSVDELIRILNIFAFFVFLSFVLSLNVVGLFILPYFVKTSLTLND
jgi:hypothetical protein